MEASDWMNEIGLTRADQARFWTVYRPRILHFLDRMESVEDWAIDPSKETSEEYLAALEALRKGLHEAGDSLPDFIEVLSALHVRQVLYLLGAITQTDHELGSALLTLIYERRGSDPHAHALWQQIRKGTRAYQVAMMAESCIEE